MGEHKAPRCGNCHYARSQPSDPRRLDAPRVVECHIAPPRVFPAMAQGIAGPQLGTMTAGWPVVAPSSWCGQWQQADALVDLGGS